MASENPSEQHQNSILPLSSQAPSSMLLTEDISPTVALGAGCYWGTEKFVVKDFQKKFPKSIKSAKVGFMSPNDKADSRKKKGPTYNQVCSGVTGYVEVLNITLHNPALLPELVQFFFQFHDPTTLNRQGNDHGTQYASAIFVQDPTQKQVAEKVRNDLQELINQRKIKCYNRAHVETKIYEYTQFFSAHAAHQNYLAKNPFGYCNHRIRFQKWPKRGASGSKKGGGMQKGQEDSDSNDVEPKSMHNNKRKQGLLAKLRFLARGRRDQTALPSAL